jgi:peptidoglycan/LPS O-acetylase OafA/YrhL
VVVAQGSDVDGHRAEVRRVQWLDGIRGAAALFVVLHHTWLSAWPAFPSNTGPWWLGWLLYGHLAVAVFIVVSGFSLALAPMNNGGSLKGGVRRFLRRRAWRIIPPYWAALIISTIITDFVVSRSLGGGEIGKSFVVHGLLLQDVIGSAPPNGAFWSIAVEWQIYFVFPVILLVGRRFGLKAAVLLTVATVLVAHLVAGLGAPLDKIDHLSPAFLALFALGVLAVQLSRGGTTRRFRVALVTTASLALGFVLVAAALEGSEWLVGRYFYVDLVFGLGIACIVCALHAGLLSPVRRVLSAPVALGLGRFSYSLYLLHGPIGTLVWAWVIAPIDASPLAKFALMLVIGLPFILATCYAFHLAFEAPFLRHRGMGALREIPLVRRFRRRSGVTPPRRDVVPVRETA